MMNKKAYSYFKTPEDINDLGLSQISEKLFATILPVEPSELLLRILDFYQGVPIQSEKAKSELLITPVINDIRLRNSTRMTYFSGYLFNVDKKLGLTGFCDFIISRKYNAVFIESPIAAIVEAKHNQDLLDAAPQCIAEMRAAQIFNERNDEFQPVIYGAVTNGYEWLFLKLRDKMVSVDIERYGLKNMPELLGVWQIILEE